VVLRVPGARQAVALDRVCEDDRRPGIVDRLEGLLQDAEVVAAQVGDHGRQLLVRYRPEQLRHGRPARPVTGQPGPELGRRAAQQPLVLWVGHLVDPAPQLPAPGAGEQALQETAELQGEYLPARRGEHPGAA
jgi:hypothetical protein